MARRVRELTPIEIRNVCVKGNHAVGGVAGLYLQVRPPQGKSWILRAVIGEKRRDIGLGSFPDITLSDARVKARQFKDLISCGIDPVQQARDNLQAQIIAQRQYKTFSDVAQACYAVKRQEFKSAKHSAQWMNTLKTYAYPVIGNHNIESINTQDILSILKPIWESKTETATRVRQRIATVFVQSVPRLGSTPLYLP
ncbi:MAG: hypothetical protein A6F71_07220 [Cycloclasticus sp. symbiont of Poecilosclerida sp. M]|nr:MAG: hypothetical protein A6F71_07220 [Cycloclasticus sp. symbiont of Poecilosclerida sp. M]